MLHEHALTYKDRLLVVDLEYLVKKANKLGLSGREVIYISEEKDIEGTHIYYHVTGLSNDQRRIKD